MYLNTNKFENQAKKKQLREKKKWIPLFYLLFYPSFVQTIINLFKLFGEKGFILLYFVKLLIYFVFFILF
jgi:hypothetical protein